MDGLFFPSKLVIFSTDFRIDLRSLITGQSAMGNGGSIDGRTHVRAGIHSTVLLTRASASERVLKFWGDP